MSSILNPNQHENEPLLATGPPLTGDESGQISDESVQYKEPTPETGLLVTKEEVEQIVAENAYYEHPLSATGLSLISDEVRQIIAKNAYYKAEKRGFTLGFEGQDWMESEKDVLTRLWPVLRTPNELLQKGVPATAR
jgi:hypothetical protein